MNAENFLKANESNADAFIPYGRVVELLAQFGQLQVDRHKNGMKIKSALDRAAQEETYRDWNQAINDYADPSKGNPGRYTIDDIVYRAFEIYSGTHSTEQAIS